MASFPTSIFAFYLIILILSSTHLTITIASFSHQSADPKTTHLHFFFHDTITGKNPTAMQITQPPNGSTRGFGTTFMMDDPLTEGPDLTSKLVGRSQGLYALASQHEFGLLMVLTFVFTEGVFNGSALSVVGRNAVMETVREMPVVGGTGVFRYGRGFALAKTYMFHPQSGVAIVEYNVSVLHV